MKGFFERQPIETQKTLVALGSQLNATVRELIARYDLKKLEMQFKPAMYPNIIFAPFSINEAVGISRHWLDVVGYREIGHYGLRTFNESLEVSKKIGMEAIMPYGYPNIDSINNFYYRCLNYGNPSYRRGEIDIETQKAIFIASLSCLTNNTLTDNAARGVPEDIKGFLASQRDERARYNRALSIKELVIPLVADIDETELTRVSEIIRESR